MLTLSSVSTSATPSIRRTGYLYKRAATPLRRVRSSVWITKLFTLYADGTISYKDWPSSAQPPSASLPVATPSNSSTTSSLVWTGSQIGTSSSEDDEPTHRIALFPVCADVLSRQEQFRMAEALPPGTDLRCVFKLRLRGQRSRTLYLCAQTSSEAKLWREDANESSLAALPLVDASPLHRILQHHYFLDVWDAVASVSTPPSHVAETDLGKLAKRMSCPSSAVDLHAHLTKLPEQLSYGMFIHLGHRLILNKTIQTILSEVIGPCYRNPSALDSIHQVAQALNMSEKEVSSILEQSNFKAYDPLDVLQFLLSPQNAALDPRSGCLDAHDMTYPLSDYYINSSHNTYLVGDQVTSKSSAEMYRLVLESGTRCVEVDLWDGDSGPLVTHGRTLTSAVPFETVLRVIKESAFVNSPFPVIISIESHLSAEMQRKAARSIRKILKDLLYVIRPDSRSSLPSPQELKGKILIKAKTGVSRVDPRSRGNSSSSDDLEFLHGPEDLFENDVLSEIRISSEESANDSADLVVSRGGIVSSSSISCEKKAVDQAFEKWLQLKHLGSLAEHGLRNKVISFLKCQKAVVEDIAELTSFAGNNRREILDMWSRGIAHWKGQSVTDVVSLGEARIGEAYATGFVSCIERFNQRNLIRVFPKGVRVNSGNYNPMNAWRAGCQMVALNMQSPDLGTWLNFGRFNVNGNCGYALKQPPCFADGIHGAGTLQIKVMTGFFLPHIVSKLGKREVGHYYVEAAVAGCECNGVPYLHREVTNVIREGFAPSWQSQFTLRVDDASLDLLLVRLWNRDRTARHDLLGFYCAPVHALRTGIRAFHLVGEDCSPLTVPGSEDLVPTLLCKIEWSTKVG